MGNKSYERRFSVLLLAAGVWSSGCEPPAAMPPPVGPPPPELHISDEDAQGEADPAPPPNTPEPAQAPAAPNAPPPPPSEAGQMSPQPQPGVAAPGGPSGPAASAPPAPPAGAQVVPQPPPSASSGQWIYTSQYGWLWLPYSREYTYVSGDGGAAYEYAYYPNGGWRWVYAPWVLGWGPSPYWGRLGPRPYVWYSRPWFRVGVVHRGPVYHRHWHRR